MKKILYILIGLELLIPAFAYAVVQNPFRIPQLLQNPPTIGVIMATSTGGYLTGSSSPTVNYITATSTTATSTFGYGIQLLGGCVSVQGTCLTGVSSQWTTSGTNVIENLAGNVGIGTTTPDSKLDVNGTVRFEGTSSIETSSIGGAIIGVGCDTGNTTVSSGGLSSTTALLTTPEQDPGTVAAPYSIVLNPTTIQTKVCSAATVTPNSVKYIVKIIK